MNTWLNQFADYIRSTGVALPDGWLPWGLDSSREAAPVGFMKVTGSVPIGKKKNGSPKWGPKKNSQSYFIDNEKMAAWKKQQEPAQ